MSAIRRDGLPLGADPPEPTSCHAHERGVVLALVTTRACCPG
ncbi:hypothetical protein I552_6279 [Mycobacterium xenopi 3993]|nr:hypothetical protein I552_6279 [Mycobacterium xenopi 3993]